MKECRVPGIAYRVIFPSAVPAVPSCALSKRGTRHAHTWSTP